MTQQKMWCLKVQRVSGDFKILRLSNDLQRALSQEPDENILLKGALIVIPLAPYFNSKKQSIPDRQPPMGVAQIHDIFQLRKKQTYRLPDARGQFVGVEYWPKRSLKKVQKYLCHDYSFWSQQQIKSDVMFWKKQYLKKSKKSAGLIKIITNARIRQQIKKINHYRVKESKDFWQLKD